ncbi:hypothetical protein FRC02_006233 [Tulasnella sp. 418]|nr:hypothetical protein FRC02_006233 [Tulasnella sp. 418]
MDSVDLSPSLFYGALGILSAGILYRVSKIGQREPLLPPGPPTTPVLGNIAILPKTNTYVKFNEWAKQYGEMLSLKVGPKTIIVLSSPDAVFQVMEKNGLITANKPSKAHTLRVFGEDGFLTIVQYGPLYRTWRRAANEMMSLSACERLAPIQLGEASQLLVGFLDRPEDFFEEIKRTVLSVAFSVFFGVRSPSMSLPEPQTFLRATEKVFQLSAPGAYPPVDLIPILHYLPDRFANYWKQKSEELRIAYEGLWSGLLSKAERKTEAGISTGCFIETLTARASEWNLDRMTIR